MYLPLRRRNAAALCRAVVPLCGAALCRLRCRGRAVVAAAVVPALLRALSRALPRNWRYWADMAVDGVAGRGLHRVYGELSTGWQLERGKV